MSPVKYKETITETLSNAPDITLSYVEPGIIPEGRSETFILGKEPNRRYITVYGTGLVTLEVPQPNRTSLNQTIANLSEGSSIELEDYLGNRVSLEYIARKLKAK